MKQHAIPFAFLVSALGIACGATLPTTDLPCPCATGYVCCGKICIAGSTCGGDTLYPVDGAILSIDASGSGTSSGKTTPPDAGSEGSGGDSAKTAFCQYASNAGDNCAYENGNPDEMDFPCGCMGTQGSVSQAAQTELNCMSGGGVIVDECPSTGLIGCCTSSFGDFAGVGYPEGDTVACSYGVDMQYKLQCLAYGGSWSVTAPR